jgi:hypothetical protein
MQAIPGHALKLRPAANGGPEPAGLLPRVPGHSFSLQGSTNANSRSPTPVQEKPDPPAFAWVGIENICTS